MSQTIGITGGTGFVGTHITNALVAKGYHVIIFSRSNRQSSKKQVSYAHWDPSKEQIDLQSLQKLDAVIHLAGAGVADKRWTTKRKQIIEKSRTEVTRFLVNALKEHANNCKTFLAASAIGYYGPDRDNSQPFTEEDRHFDDFLGNTCYKWEQESLKAQEQFRTAIIRIGIVLGSESGAFVEFEKPTRFGVLPILGSGKQMVSWIHVKDLASIFIHTLDHEKVTGITNGVAPNPVSNKQLMRTIAQIKGGLKIPVPVPAFALKVMLGEMSVEVLKSCTVSSDKTVSLGYEFIHPTIEDAVADLLKSK